MLSGRGHTLNVFPRTGNLGEPDEIGTDIAGMGIGHLHDGNLIVDSGQDFVILGIDK